jgi:hypothetical protein
MTYDDVKDFEGQAYSGMAVGGRHSWVYPDGRWEERKVAPDKWEISFASAKRRVRASPKGSGAVPGTQFHWYILGHQKVRKLDEDTYDTLLEGVKHKIAHKRPHWRKWSTGYHPPTEREKLIAILEEALAQARAQPEPQARLTAF